VVQTAARSFPRADKPRLTGPADAEGKVSGAAARGVESDREKQTQRQPFFGLTVVFCEHGVIRQSPDGLYIYTETGREEITLPTGHGRAEELKELANAIAEGRPAFPDGRWGKATLEVCLAIMASSRDGRIRKMKHQVPAP